MVSGAFQLPLTLINSGLWDHQVPDIFYHLEDLKSNKDRFSQDPVVKGLTARELLAPAEDTLYTLHQV